MKKIAVVTGSRAEYGLLVPLMKAIRKDRTLRLQTIVTGMHLCRRYGSTCRQIASDGFQIDRKVDLGLGGDSPLAIARATGKGVSSFARVFRCLEPDLLVVLGDRFEIFAAVVAAHIAGIPVAHIQGGEVTSGAMDDAFRHAITKMSSLHFASTDVYRRRIIQLGEDPETVFTVGALGVENVHRLELLDREALERSLGMRLRRVNLLVTYHPVTRQPGTAGKQINALLSALKAFPRAAIFFTMPNADTENRIIVRQINRFARNCKDRCGVFVSLGQVRYLSLMRCADAVIGNSSSGIIEAPAFGKPTVNIGSRQDGRVKSAGVIDCNCDAASIERAVRRALSPGFAAGCRRAGNPYDGGIVSLRILAVIKRRAGALSLIKPFHDL